MRTALVTGAASGFGWATATALSAAGWRVVGADEQPLASGWGAGFDARLLDVRDELQVAELAGALGDVDLVVNNAGYAVFGTQEEVSIEAVRDLFEVNVFGPARVTRAFLPGLRRRRGVVIQLSSVAGRTVFPESGYYAASKHALEAMSEALVQEVSGFGVRVRVVEPGSFDTGFAARAVRSSPAPADQSPYTPLRAAWSTRKTEVLEPPQPARWVAEAILRSLEDPAPFLRVPVGADAERILALRDALGPDAWTMLAVERAGGPATPLPGGVPGPDVVLTLSAGHPDFERARLADHARHLGHWEQTPVGRTALHRLRAPSTS